MFRTLVFLTSCLVGVTPASSASYSARLAVTDARSFIAADISWTCSAGACEGTTAESRPIVLCESLAKHSGRIDSFLVDGRAFTAAELDTCNAVVKARPAKALAAQ